MRVAADSVFEPAELPEATKRAQDAIDSLTQQRRAWLDQLGAGP